ncbi:hypothetical protein PITC_038050 [Penicillium italicum]|uniref:Uncharacterized protein n=1 Tax=Penicillium italicum TaxID=40296 RepID=A0A0A2LBL2_PENIT|nr:hypothetical protein PITC_038050 [Penicillium italicum]
MRIVKGRRKRETGTLSEQIDVGRPLRLCTETQTKEGRSLGNAREESAQGVKRRVAEKFEAKMSESQAKQIAIQVGRKLATKTRKDRNGKD